MKHNALIVLEALLLGQRVTMPTGHVLVMEGQFFYIVGEMETTAGREDVYLDPGALRDLASFVHECSRMSPEDVFILGAQNAMIKEAKEREEARTRWRAEYTNNFPTATPCPDCGGSGQGRLMESCPECRGTGRNPL